MDAKKKGFTIIELLVVAGIFFLMVGALTPFVRMVKQSSQVKACANNLRTISLGLHAYAADHNDSFPGALGDLYPNYVTGEKVFDCPASKRCGTKEKTDYKYITALTESSSPKEVVVEDLDGNHGKHGKNILRIDGTVECSGSG